MKRKLIYSLLVGIVLTIGITSVEASSTNEWCFGFNKKTNTISNYKNNSVKCPTNVVIPETIDGITYNNSTGVFSLDSGRIIPIEANLSKVKSVNGMVGDVIISTTNIKWIKKEW